MARDSAASTLSSTTRMRRAGTGVRLRRRRGAAVRCDASDQKGQAHDELAARSQPVALRRDGAAVHLDQALDQVQADSQPALRSFERAIDLGKHVEDVREAIGGNADAGVSHAHDGIVVQPFGDHPDASARWRVSAGVVQEVAEHLTESRRIGDPDTSAREGRRRSDRVRTPRPTVDSCRRRP